MKKITLWNMDCLLPTLLTQFACLGIHLSSLYSHFAMLFLCLCCGRFTEHFSWLCCTIISVVVVTWLWGVNCMPRNLRTHISSWSRIWIMHLFLSSVFYLLVQKLILFAFLLIVEYGKIVAISTSLFSIC